MLAADPSVERSASLWLHGTFSARHAAPVVISAGMAIAALVRMKTATIAALFTLTSCMAMEPEPEITQGLVVEAEPDDIPCTFLKGLPSEMSEPPLPAEIVTPEDFTALAMSSPLASLSPESYRRFVDSLVFHEKGIASFRYVEIEAELETDEIEALYLMLGMRKGDGTIRDYYCGGRATCRQEQGAICVTSNC